MFKVVPDQLKIAQGWVRCGHCGDVFDAQLSMQVGEAGEVSPVSDDDQVSSAQVSAHAPGSAETFAVSKSGAAAPASISAVPRAVPRWIIEAAQDVGDLVQIDGGQRLENHSLAAGASWAPDVPDDFDPAAWKAAQQKRQLLNQRDALANPGLSVSSLATAAPTGLSRPAALDSVFSQTTRAVEVEISNPLHQTVLSLSGQVESRDDSEDETYFSYRFDDSESLSDPDAAAAAQLPAAPSESADELSFVRQARLANFWRQRRVRVGLAMLVPILTVALALQGIVQFRDVLAALAPEAARSLDGLCEVAGCVVQPVRRIDSVVIDSSTFNKLGSDSYRLSFALKNTAAIALGVPWLEVTLTDLHNQAVVRRVVSPAQFGVTAGTIGPHAEVVGLLNLWVVSDPGKLLAGSISTADAPLPPIAGYRVLAFYP